MIKDYNPQCDTYRINVGFRVQDDREQDREWIYVNIGRDNLIWWTHNDRHPRYRTEYIFKTLEDCVFFKLARC